MTAPDRPFPAVDDETARACLRQLEKRIPAALGVLASPLPCGYEPGAGETRPPALQPSVDAAALAGEEAARLLGPETGRACRQTLEYDFTALTANHHGADFHPEFVQGNLLFALRRSRALVDAPFAPVAPVFSFSSVPLGNPAYPRGIVLGRPECPGSALPRRLPVLSGRARWTPVSLLPPFTLADVGRARALLRKTRWAGTLPPHEEAAVHRFLAEVFLDPSVLRQGRYADQAVIMNSLIWRRLFAPGFQAEPPVPLLVTLEMERLVQALLMRDLADPYSLAYALLLEPECRAHLLSALAGVRGCWAEESLEPQAGPPFWGTLFFWGLDRCGRRFSLALGGTDPLRSVPLLVGHDAHGERHTVPLEGRALVEALRERRLLPGLYLCFAVLHLARGLRCGGGVLQLEYAPAMRRGTALALACCGEETLADRVAAVPETIFSTGFLPLRCRAGADASHAAGPVELLARGGIKTAQWEALGRLGVAEAFRCALAYHYEDMVPKEARLGGWFEALAHEGGIMLD